MLSDAHAYKATPSRSRIQAACVKSSPWELVRVVQRPTPLLGLSPLATIWRVTCRVTAVANGRTPAHEEESRWRAHRSQPVPAGDARRRAGDKGLKQDALGCVSNLVIGVASTAPGYSLAATLGFVVAVGIGSTRRRSCSSRFIPMLLIAAAYYYMNRADPDCGTSFTWVTRAMGPRLGWLTGWTIVVADVVVMAALAYIAGSLHLPALRPGRGRRQPARRQHRRGGLDHRDDLDLLRRDRALGADPVRACWRRRSSTLGALRGRRPASRSTSGDPARRPRRALLVQPVRPPRRHQRPRRRRAARRSSSTGAGTAASASTRSPRTAPTAPAGRR